MWSGRVRIVGWVGVSLIVFLNLLVLGYLGLDVYSSHRSGPLVIHDAKGFQDVFDTYRDRVDGAQKLITALIGLSSLYALALGFTTYLGAQQYLQTLKETAAQVEALRARTKEQVSEQVRLMRRQRREARLEAARERVELQKHFPLFGSMDKMLSGVLNEMRFLSVAFMVDFDEMDEDAWRAVRAKIQFYERAFAGFDLLDDSGYEKQVIDAFSYLGRFYRRNFQKTRNPDELERARFYGEIAVKKSRRRYVALNNLSAIWLDKELGKARELAQESLDKHPKQQRALYILAWIDDEEGNYAKAVRGLEEALKMTVWEERPDRMDSAVHYNLACALSKLAAQQENGRDENLNEAVKNLKIGVAAEEALRKQFEEDLSGDLKFLATTKPDAIEEIRNVRAGNVG
jgi:hypothetical protein